MVDRLQDPPSYPIGGLSTVYRCKESGVVATDHISPQPKLMKTAS